MAGFRSLVDRVTEEQDEQKRLLYLLIPFFVVFVICAVLLQIESGEQPSDSGTVVDRFTGGLLWVASVAALLIAARASTTRKSLVLWILVSAAAGALAIDEMLEFHERTVQVVGEDDYSKILMWVGAIAGGTAILRISKPGRRMVLAMIIGFAFHTAYLLVDLGDGDFYQLPMSRGVADWVEELLEIAALEAYLAGLLLHLAGSSRRRPDSPALEPPDG